MIRALTAALLASMSLPALAVETPQVVSNDGLVCTQNYDQDKVALFHLEQGRATTIEVVASEKIDKVSVSDSVHLMFSVLDGTNIFWMKPVGVMPAQPISIVTTRDDGSHRIYLAQVDAKPPADEARVNLVTVGGASPNKPCYLIRYASPADDAARAAAKAAALRKAQAARGQDVRNAALLREHQLANQNSHYVAQGDRNLAPDRIFDDGYSTFLQYDGNRPVPAPYEVGSGDQDKLLSGWNSEDNVCPGGIAPTATCLKLHAVLKRIRLRDREDLAGKKPALTIFNRAFNAVGSRPGTGTSSPAVQREVAR